MARTRLRRACVGCQWTVVVVVMKTLNETLRGGCRGKRLGELSEREKSVTNRISNYLTGAPLPARLAKLTVANHVYAQKMRAAAKRAKASPPSTLRVQRPVGFGGR
ncbi:hypothetical protein BZA05DRAFT_414646 [Tricharina praecox]|uniref:uncharacterized protein n=1 Tax=Tricharina praecox TaxID=43433 RepID=UPI0022208E14|nr:uncharacterized protein BZA05DRAFT_414646 [Tricharina praecox]KAI5858895.1 hypothetical protein BZA05DRAFT_414646 [Tricharina praecox]